MKKGLFPKMPRSLFLLIGILLLCVSCKVTTPEEAEKKQYLLERTSIFLLPEVEEYDEVYEAGIQSLWDAEYPEALSIFEELVKGKETAATLNGLAMAQYYLGDYTGAEKSFKKALELEENDQQRIALANNMGGALAALKKYDESGRYYTRALNIGGNSLLKKNDFLTYICIQFNLSENGANTWDTSKVAENKLRKLLDEIHNKPYTDPLLEAYIESQIIPLNYRHIGIEKSIWNAKKNLAVIKGVFGEGHPQVTFILENIALMTEDIEKSIEQYGIIIENYEKKLGKGHLYTGRAYYNRGIRYGKKQNSEKERECYERSLEIYENITTGPTESHYPYYNIGGIYWTQDQPEEALSYVLNAYKSVLKNDPYNKKIIEMSKIFLQTIYTRLEMPETEFDEWLEEQVAGEDADGGTESEAA